MTAAPPRLRLLRLSLPLLLSALLAPSEAAKWPLRAPHREAVPASFDCAMRQAAYAYGKKLIPRLGSFPSLYFALGLNAECGDGSPPPSATGAPPSSRSQLPPDALYVAARASTPPHAEEGTATRPFSCLQKAADAAVATRSKTVVLRGGTHFLPAPLRLGERHSGLSFVSMPGETPVVSGGTELNVTWEAYDLKDGRNIWSADVKGQVDEVPGLQIDGKRATRARYPNLDGGIEVSPGYGGMIPGSSAVWTPPQFGKYAKVDFYTDNTSSHARPNGGWFEQYMIGTNGLCSVYDPPVSYWCSEHPSGGGAFAFRTPSGVTPQPAALPHAPYKYPLDALFFVWRPSRWANWMFEVAAYDSQTANYTFGKGGNQGARGSNSGGDFFVENVFEELDQPGEFFYDRRAGTLYLYHNGTGAPPASASVVVPRLRTLVNISASRFSPAKNISYRGITFKATRYTYMDPHGVPSAGDWALDRVGAIFLQGTENVTFDSCTFERLDGNAVMVSGYNRHATISNSDFAFIGGNAVAAWGYTNETATDPGRPGEVIENYPQAGVDGTDGNHPRYTTVEGCTAREVGLYEKQSSFFVQAKTVQSRISGNVFFNGPRAGINANDGFGGGDEISHNLVFSTCRESGDHGPFNSWDRQPFLTSVRTGAPSMTMAWREIHHNFFIDNYSPQEDVDNDDGSCYYHTHHNFLVYGGQGMKNDFGGHDNHHFNNIYAYVGQGCAACSRRVAAMTHQLPVSLQCTCGGSLGVCSQQPGHEDYFYGNKAVITGDKLGGFACTGDAKTIVHDNQYFTPTGAIQECGVDLKDWQAKGEDVNSTVSRPPGDSTIIGWAKVMLDF